MVFKTIYKTPILSGKYIFNLEKLIKKEFGFIGYLNKDEMSDGFTETVKYSKENLKKIKSIVDKVLNEKAEKKK